MDSCRAEDRSELEVLQSQGVVGAGVEPEVRVGATQRSRSCVDSVQRCVDRQAFELPPEDRMVLGGTLVAGPALDERELAWMLKRDVDRAVPAFGQAADAAPSRRGDRPVTRVDRVDDVAPDERPPAFGGTDAVRPLLVRERARGAERHREDQRLRELPGEELVLDDPHPDGQEKGERPEGETVQQVEHGIALDRMATIAGRQVDVDRLTPTSERRARDLDLLDAPPLRDVGRVTRRRKSAVEPGVPGIPVYAGEANGDEGAQGGDQHWREPASRHELVLQPVRLSGG